MNTPAWLYRMAERIVGLKTAPEPTPSDIIREGRAAGDLLSGPVFGTAVEKVTADILADWCRAESDERRTELWYEQKMLAKVCHRLATMKAEADLTERQLDPQTSDPRLGAPEGVGRRGR